MDSELMTRKVDKVSGYFKNNYRWINRESLTTAWRLK